MDLVTSINQNDRKTQILQINETRQLGTVPNWENGAIWDGPLRKRGEV